MLLLEQFKNFFTPHKKSKASSTVNPEKVINNLSDDTGPGKFNDFFDYDAKAASYFTSVDRTDLILKQMEKIMSYRQVAMQAEVTNAIDIIVDEIIFSYDGFPLKFNLNDKNQKLQKGFEKAWKKIIKLGNFNKNLFDFIRRSYIDGQMIVHCEYDPKRIKKGIQAIRMIDPVGFYFDAETQTWKYADNNVGLSNLYFNKKEDEEYQIEEIVRTDFGIWHDHLCLSYLEYAIKSANMLKTLEDLLIPLRFSRSMSRRVFNVDVGDLPTKRAEEYMKDIQKQFRYKKFYNNETGEVTNQQHITSMVEDYWFANRSGSRGTEVTTIDESGNLGELTDIIYFCKKLYRSLHIPSSHLDIDPDADHTFSSDPTDTTTEDVKFMNFISRVRKVYCEFFKDLLKREVISTGVLKESEWNRRDSDIEIVFSNENLFIEKMKSVVLQGKIDSWSSAKDIGGTVMSFSNLMRQTFGFTEQEIQQNLIDIKHEIKDPAFRKLYEDAGFIIGDEIDEYTTQADDLNKITKDKEDSKDDEEDLEDSEYADLLKNV